MSKLLQFVSVWEFLLRYTVIVGIIVAMLGVMCCFLSKMFANRDNGNKHLILLTTGLVLLLLGMIIMVLPIADTLYKG